MSNAFSMEQHHILTELLSSNMNYFIYTSHYFTPHGKIWSQLIDLAPNVWLHSSVSRASHRYSRGHGFESRWSPNFFRLLLSNCLNWKIYCHDHSSLSSLPLLYTFFIYCTVDYCYLGEGHRFASPRLKSVFALWWNYYYYYYSTNMSQRFWTVSLV